MKRMLLVFAHPDDESFTSAATIAKYAKAGWTIDLISATRGEKGETGSHGEKTPEELGIIRQKELENAASHLGISTITFLKYIDGDLKYDPPGELEEIIYQKMVELIPDVVITFDTTGISNHPDHIRLSFATTFAFQKYAAQIKNALKDNPEYTEESDPKLYYACVPDSVVEYLKKKRIFPEESFGKPWIGVEDKFITTVISTEGFQQVKKRALKCHVSQTEDVTRFLSLPHNPLVKQEYYIFRMHGVREIFMGKNDRVASKL